MAFDNPNSRAGRKRDTAQRTADGVFKAWETRTQLVKSELAAASAATDAKTARLRALRLEKERLDAEAALAAPPPPAKKPAKPKSKRIIA